MFDFDTLIHRSASDSQKWRKYHGSDIIPLWVADMDFVSPPAVIEALHNRVAHGVFGYGALDRTLTETIGAHLFEKYQWQIAPEWIVWLPGLVTGLNLACRSTGQAGSAVLTHVPVYPPFLSAPRLSGRQLHTTSLVLNGSRWQMDFDALQRALDTNTALFLLCNPHNPTGRAFTRNELTTLAEICLRRNVIICSDEIHCDLILEPSCRHIPLATLAPQVADRTITLMAPSKTYNIPGLGCAFAIISNPALRRRFKHAMAGIVPDVNLFGFVAARAAFCHGQAWLTALLDYLRVNRDMVRHLIGQMPGMQMGIVEATYLAWIDTRPTRIAEPVRFFEQNGVGLSDGREFGAAGFVRLNFGCPRQLLNQALERMANALHNVSP